MDYLAAHLDHTDDRTGWIGLSHPACNASAGGKAAHVPPDILPGGAAHD